ncbi:MAG TPA: MazG nucleotide pyrophosphohydrolase domain-containing protein, partial [Chthoniobacterales bacterium]|nr:MazG nucleotide pyrophosphohydrolase domain-containing protein [Chthoniobacterales bacterium]
SGNADAVADEIGDLLFAAVNLARKARLDAESLLQRATDKFVRRFNAVETELRERGKKLGEADLDELDEIWNAINAEQREREIA